jgi:hypothetical protein
MDFDAKIKSDLFMPIEGSIDSDLSTSPKRAVVVVEAGCPFAERCKARHRQYPSPFCEHSDRYYESLAGPNTSQCDFEQILCALETLEIWDDWRKVNEPSSGYYDAKSGIWFSSDRVPVTSMSDVRRKLDARIVELGIDQQLLEDWLLGGTQTFLEEQQWRRQNFSTRMNIFRKQVAA